MDRFIRKQNKIDRRAAKAIETYPSRWSQMINQWNQPGPGDKAWLMYSANYLFRTGDVRWAMDPLRLMHRLRGAPDIPAGDLQGLDFILLTHEHGDHLDLGLLRQLQAYPVLWVVPASVLERAGSQLNLPPERLIVPQAMQPFELFGMRITPFDGLHWEAQPGTDAFRGVPATGYLVECNGKRWLFPGDTRTYDHSQLPYFGPVDVIFAHLWLGREASLLPDPPLLDRFCQFFVDLQPKRVILTHMDEFGRGANDFWDLGHSRKVSTWFREHAPDIDLQPAYPGQRIKI